MTGRRSRVHRRQRGFALLIVLWTVGLLALLAARLSATARFDAEHGAAGRASAEAETMADGLIDEAIFRLLDPSPRGWRPGPIRHRVAVPGGEAYVTISDQYGLINPNTASVALLAALLRRVGAAPDLADPLASAIVDWHSIGPESINGGTKLAKYEKAHLSWAPPGQKFASIREMALLPGMTPEILARLMPCLTVATPGNIDIAQAPPAVAEALREVGGERQPPIPDQGGQRVLGIVAEVRVPGARAVRQAVIRIDLDAEPDDGGPYEILSTE